ncbi:MAG: hypothetical protein K5853_10105 [Lachnospiraceae bacterium]|nr:hypothetical protein [Lachnospiraceae bacterium]
MKCCLHYKIPNTGECLKCSCFMKSLSVNDSTLPTHHIYRGQVGKT